MKWHKNDSRYTETISQSRSMASARTSLFSKGPLCMPKSQHCTPAGGHGSCKTKRHEAFQEYLSLPV